MPWRIAASSASFARTSQLRQFGLLQPKTVRLYSKAHPYRPSRDIASILDSPQNRDTTPRNVEIIAHVRSVRSQKQRAFASLGDGSTSRPLQALLEPEQASGLTTGTAVKICGSWRPSPAAGQTHEMKAHSVEILGAADPQTYPIQKKHLTPEFLRTIPHLRVRTKSNANLARLRSESDHMISRYFNQNGYIRLHPPAITSSDCEGAGEVFTVRPKANPSPTSTGPALKEEEFFKSPKYLTVSNQLHLEAFVHEHQRVWALAPTFRAERSDTPRHLSEFYMLEAELRTTSLDEVMDVVESLVRDLANKIVAQKYAEVIEAHHETESENEDRRQMLASRYDGLRQPYWPRITYTQAIQMLLEEARNNPDRFSFKPSWETGLQLEHEKYIAAAFGGKTPVFVTEYPKQQKPFYMLPSHISDVTVAAEATHHETDSATRWKPHALPPKPTIEQHLQEAHPTVACFDLLLPNMGELVGGSLREHRHEYLQAAMHEKGVTNIDWYLELRKYGSVPHGGFGLGFDRLLMYLSGVESVRDVVQWPRYYGKCDA